MNQCKRLSLVIVMSATIINDACSLIFPGLYYVELSVTFYTESIFRRTKRTSAKTMLQLKDILFREFVL